MSFTDAAGDGPFTIRVMYGDNSGQFNVNPSPSSPGTYDLPGHVYRDNGTYVMPNLPTGPYRLEVALQGFKTYAQTGIVLQVADNGPGIPAADRQRSLQPFVRLERDREQVGSGLGLSLVKWIVVRHHGRIEVESEPGKGSTFTEPAWPTVPACRLRSCSF